MNRTKTLLISLLFFSLTEGVCGQTRLAPLIDQDSGEPELTVCSQNLRNYSGPGKKKIEAWSEHLGSIEPNTKEGALIDRFVEAKCDVIGVQEINGNSDEETREALSWLALLLRKKTARPYEVQVASVNESNQRVGMIIAKDRADIVNVISYRKVLLPRIDDNQKPRQFTRAPLEVQLTVKGRNGAPTKTVSIVVLHFKSKSDSKSDAAALAWETTRIEMAEGIRRILEERYKSSFEYGDIPLIVMGDRNSNFDSASAFVLQGSLTIDDFKGKPKPKCRISKRGVPLCQVDAIKPVKFFSVLTSDPETKNRPGTFIFNKEYSWLDDILMPQSTLVFARANVNEEGNYDSGVIFDHGEASDHALVYVRLNW